MRYVTYKSIQFKRGLHAFGLQGPFKLIRKPMDTMASFYILIRTSTRCRDAYQVSRYAGDKCGATCGEGHILRLFRSLTSEDPLVVDLPRHATHHLLSGKVFKLIAILCWSTFIYQVQLNDSEAQRQLPRASILWEVPSGKYKYTYPRGFLICRENGGNCPETKLQNCGSKIHMV